ncbi:MAG: hypothetical protein JNJ54_08405 [Myxococcaceae bacterium]|nr:hypothetical protein [Myxococcaceae bacterium]
MRVPVPTGGATVAAASLLAGAVFFFAPLIDGFVRVRVLKEPDHRALVMNPGGANRPCIAHQGGSMCWPLVLYPVLVPGWWRDRVRSP